MFSRKQPTGPVLNRNQSLKGRPVKLPVVKQSEIDTGGVRITVRFQPKGWVRWLGGTREVERTFELDYLGREVYEACDGSRDVQALIRNFSNHHQVSLPEAEYAVTAYLNTLMSRAMISIEIDPATEKKKREKRRSS